MKKYINKKATLICLGLAAIITIISIIVPLIKPKNNKEEDYSKITLFTMNDKTMTFDEAYFIAKERQAYFEQYYHTYYSAFSWDTIMEPGKTNEDIMLEQLFSYIQEVFVLSEYALANGMALTDNENKAALSEADSFMSNSSSKVLTATKANADLANRIFTRIHLYNKATTEILKDKDLTISLDDARVCTIGVATVSPEKFDSPERVANEIADRVNNGDVIGGVAKTFDIAEEKTFIDKDSTLPKEFVDFCLSLKDDECKVLELDGTYYAVYCYLENDEVETAAKKQFLLEEKKANYVAAFVEELIKEQPISVNTEIWNTVNFDTPIYTKEDVVQYK